MFCTQIDVNFSYSTAAGFCSAVAGILGGFAFSGILLAITHNALRRDNKTLGRAVAAFVAAFFGLLLSSVQYAVMAGELIQPQRSGRLAVEEVLDSLAFGISILALLYGVVLLLQADHRLGHATTWVERVMATFGPMITLLLLLTVGQDIESVRPVKTTASITCSNVNGWQLGTYIVVGAGLVSIVLLRILRDRLPELSQDRQTVSNFVLTLALAVAIAHSVITIVYDYTLAPPAYLSFVLLATSALALNAFSFLVLATRPARSQKKKPDTRKSDEWQAPTTWQPPPTRKEDNAPERAVR